MLDTTSDIPRKQRVRRTSAGASIGGPPPTTADDADGGANGPHADVAAAFAAVAAASTLAEEAVLPDVVVPKFAAWPQEACGAGYIAGKAPAPAPAPAPALVATADFGPLPAGVQEGAAVEFHGLQGAAHLNNRNGHVIDTSMWATTGRVAVDVVFSFPGEFHGLAHAVKVKAANLNSMPPMPRCLDFIRDLIASHVQQLSRSTDFRISLPVGQYTAPPGQHLAIPCAMTLVGRPAPVGQPAVEGTVFNFRIVVEDTARGQLLQLAHINMKNVDIEVNGAAIERVYLYAITAGEQKAMGGEMVVAGADALLTLNRIGGAPRTDKVLVDHCSFVGGTDGIHINGQAGCRIYNCNIIRAQHNGIVAEDVKFVIEDSRFQECNRHVLASCGFERQGMNCLMTLECGTSYMIDIANPTQQETFDTLTNVLVGYCGTPSTHATDPVDFLEEIIEVYEDDGWFEDDDSANTQVALAASALETQLSVPESGSVRRVYTEHSYPLSRTVYSRFDVPVDAPNLTYSDLLYYFTLAYQQIYRLEDIANTTPPVCNTISMNRQTTNGPFRIWGHYICQLVYNGDSTLTTFSDADHVNSVLCSFECDS
jgi:hypothetical protein